MKTQLVLILLTILLNISINENPLIKKTKIRRFYSIKFKPNKNLLSKIKKLKVSSKLKDWVSEIDDFRTPQIFENYKTKYNYLSGGKSLSEFALIERKKIQEKKKGKIINKKYTVFTYARAYTKLRRNYRKRIERRCYNILFFFKYCWNAKISLPLTININDVILKSIRIQLNKKLSEKGLEKIEGINKKRKKYKMKLKKQFNLTNDEIKELEEKKKKLEEEKNEKEELKKEKKKKKKEKSKK